MDKQVLLFASQNRHKLEEMRLLIPPMYQLKNLTDIGWTDEIPEPFETFEENAMAKTRYIYERTGLSCFAEDSGLEIDALHGRPGVYSARYAGTHGHHEGNNRKVLLELGSRPDRTARYTAVIAWQVNHETIHLFKGRVEGSISMTPIGENGFGYDPIFIPAGFDQTFGQLPASVKQAISHRSKAFRLFLEAL